MRTPNPALVLVPALLALPACDRAGPAPVPAPSADPQPTVVSEAHVGRFSVAEWEARLEHRDSRVRLAAIQELAVLDEGARPLGPALLARLMDPEELGELRTALLGMVVPACGESLLPVLAPLFAAGGPDAQNAAAALIEIGAASDPIFLEGLASEKGEVRRLSATGMFRLFEQGLEFDRMDAAARALAPRVADDDGSVRRAAYRALVFLGERAEAAVPDLSGLLDTQIDDQAREAALAVLSSMGPAAAGAVDAIRRDLGANSDPVRLEAATAMAAIGNTDEAVPVMVAFLEHAQGMWRREGALALQLLGRRAASARAALEKAIADESEEEAKKAMDQALRALGS